jgi:ectoine hydroxylase-related dioxygenase (phytanoyl-CoA dioxygenase family)
MKAGDATFHAGWTLHCAPGNKSTQMREVMTIIFMADGAKVMPPKNQHQEADLKRWLLDQEIGTLIDSSLNPII